MITKIKDKIKLKEPDFVADESPYRHPTPDNLKFPKQFKRSWRQQWDLRFSIILLITCILEIAVIIFLMRIIKERTDQVNIEKIQKRYANLLLEKDVEKVVSPFEGEKSDASLDMPEDVLAYGESTGGGGVSEVDISEGITSDQSSVVNVPALSDYGVQNLEDRQVSRVEHDDLFVSARTREVNQRGVLGYVGNGSESEFEQEISDIFTHDEYAKEMLKNSSKDIKLAGFQNFGHNNAYVSGGGTVYSGNLKGSKTTASLEEELASLTPLQARKLEEAKKNVALDVQEESLLPDQIKRKAIRTTEYVTKILLSHKRAIQDCYKQAIKKEPDLKGKLEVRILVNPKGHVDGVQIVNSTIENTQMIRCIVSKIRRWRDFGRCDEEVGVVGYRQSYVFGY